MFLEFYSCFHSRNTWLQFFAILKKPILYIVYCRYTCRFTRSTPTFNTPPTQRTYWIFEQTDVWLLFRHSRPILDFMAVCLVVSYLFSMEMLLKRKINGKEIKKVFCWRTKLTGISGSIWIVFRYCCRILLLRRWKSKLRKKKKFVVKTGAFKKLNFWNIHSYADFLSEWLY